MRTKHLTSFILLAISFGVGILLLLMSFLPGRTRVISRASTAKGLSDLLKETPQIAADDQVKFVRARLAFANGEKGQAQQIYEELHQTYPENSVIVHNRNLTKSR